MKLRYCFAIVLSLVAALYVTAVFSRGLLQFDTSDSPAESDAAVSAYDAVELHPVAEIALPDVQAAQAPPVEPIPARDATPANEEQTPPAEPSPPRPAAQLTVPDAQRVLSFQFAGGVSTTDLQELLDERGGAVLALKLDADRVLDAVVTEGDHRLLRYYRRDDERAFDQLRSTFPPDSCFYVRWPPGANPVSEMAQRSLAQFGLTPNEYQVYLILGEPISRELQHSLDRAARQQKIAPEQITAAQATFQKTPRGLRPVVEWVQAAPGISDQ